MAGIMRVIKGVRAPGTLGQVNMHRADRAVAKIPTLSVALSPRVMVNQSVMGKNRTDGSLITKGGTGDGWVLNPANAVFNNKPTIDISGQNRFKANIDKATVPSVSYTHIICMSLSAEEIAGTTTDYLWARVSETDDTSRTAGISKSAGNIRFNANTAVNAEHVSFPIAGNITAGVPFILICQWNNATKSAKMYLTNIDAPIAQSSNAAFFSNIPAGSRHSFFYGNSGFLTFRGSWAEGYVADEALTDSSNGRLLLADVMTELKTHYGIA